MKVIFIGHSCFWVETDSFFLLFDYVDGELPSGSDPEKPLFVFASHRHGDHFSPRLRQATENFRQVTYFLSDDIPSSQASWEGIVRMEPHRTRKTEFFTVQTLRSTDEGVAFLLERNGQTLYHAGDLNCWKWEGESEAYNAGMERDYRKEMQTLAGKSVLAAFVPLDPRQGPYYDLGMTGFLQVASPRYLFPMHMWEKYEIISRFQREHGVSLQQITSNGQIFSLPEDF